MGGYNTLCELAVQRKPTLVVPRNQPRLEQTIRAELWARQRAVSVLPREALTPPALAHRVLDLLNHGPKTTSPRLDFKALDRVADRFSFLLAEEAPHAAAVRM